MGEANPALSLMLVYREIPQGLEVCDFGTGGGLPGIILAMTKAIAIPALRRFSNW